METPVFTKEEMELYETTMRAVDEKLKRKESEEDEDIFNVPTRPAPASLISYYSLKTVNVIDNIDNKDERLTLIVIDILEPLINEKASPETILQNLKKAETQEEDQTILLQKASEILSYAISDKIKRLVEKTESDTNPLIIEKHLRECWNMAITKDVRAHLVKEVKKALLVIDDEDVVSNINSAFILSILNTLSGLNIEEETDPSLNTLAVFSRNQIVLPEKKHCTPLAFTDYQSSSKNFICAYLEHEAEYSHTAKEALMLVIQLENFGIMPSNPDDFDEKKYEELCNLYYIRFNELKENAESDELKGAMIAVWNEILGPQLIILGELLFSDNYMLPDFIDK